MYESLVGCSCSMAVGISRISLTGQVKGDGQPSCFSDVEDTGIPGLQNWCHNLSIDAREQSAHNLLDCLRTFAKSIQTYVEGIGDVTNADRETLRRQWESSVTVIYGEGKVHHANQTSITPRLYNVSPQNFCSCIFYPHVSLGFR
jgi:hypothetical protein